MILLEVNEYQDFGSLQLSYDDNGNLLEDNRFLFTYDSINRITQVNRKSDNTLVATYKYDFMNRRISKEFTRTESGGNGGGNNGGGNGVGEYSTDADTIALYHYNETSGSVIDSSGNNNHGKAPRSTKRNVEGLFDTKAIKFKGAPILVRKSDSLDSIEDTLTLETFVYLDAKKWKFSRGGSLIHRLGAYQLEIDRKTRKASFSIVTKEIADENRRHKKHKHNHKHKYYNHNKPKKQFATIYSNDSIPLNQWVHIAAVYDSEKITTYINCTKQTEEKEIDGDIHDCQTPLFLGGIGFFGTMEETRISKTTRSEFNCNPTDDGNNDPGDDNSETTNIQIKRKFFYNGWRVIEEHEQQAETGQEFSNEVVSRQYVDGLGIDEHLQMITFDATGANVESEVYFHENARGDTIALTNANGETILQLEYTTYGEVFAIDDNGQILEFDDIALVVYTFQGRRSDEETGLMYFRNRYYNQELGRWLQRDPLGYVDSMGLYEAFGGNPYGYRDALGLDVYKSKDEYFSLPFESGTIKLKIESYVDTVTETFESGLKTKYDVTKFIIVREDNSVEVDIKVSRLVYITAIRKDHTVVAMGGGVRTPANLQRDNAAMKIRDDGKAYLTLNIWMFDDAVITQPYMHFGNVSSYTDRPGGWGVRPLEGGTFPGIIEENGEPCLTAEIILMVFETYVVAENSKGEIFPLLVSNSTATTKIVSSSENEVSINIDTKQGSRYHEVNSFEKEWFYDVHKYWAKDIKEGVTPPRAVFSK